MKLPEYKLDLIPINKEANNFRKFSKYCWDELGKRFKVGGNPEFIDSDEWPLCECCKEKMTFYAQLDAISEETDIGDSGLIYVFYCFNCNEVKAIVQSY